MIKPRSSMANSRCNNEDDRKQIKLVKEVVLKEARARILLTASASIRLMDSIQYKIIKVAPIKIMKSTQSQFQKIKLDQIRILMVGSKAKIPLPPILTQRILILLLSIINSKIEEKWASRQTS